MLCVIQKKTTFEQMKNIEYLQKLGFDTDPFQYTNADSEIDYIDKYFIYPDYFENVWGDISNPVSNIVYAPRGAGKTAQRIMIEKRAKSYDNILTITYTNHDLSAFKTIDDITISYHYQYLNRLLLLAFFDTLYQKENLNYLNTFNFSERQFIYKLVRIYLFETPASFPKQAINSLKTIEDRVVGLWRDFKDPIAKVIKEISKAKGLEVDISKIEIDKKLEYSHKDNFFNIITFLHKLDIETIYFLVDRVDEQTLTGNDPKASYALISPLIKDLELLEHKGIGFKFFLWDSLRTYSAVDARPDRVFSYDLEWTFNQLELMLNERVKTYSNGKITDFTKLFSKKKLFGRVILFSENSPRDCIRICNTILTEQFKSNPNSPVFEESIVNMSIDMFCKKKAQEMITNSNNFTHLTKTGSVSFTIEELVVKKVGGDAAAVRNIINPWTTSEVLKKIGIVQKSDKKRAVNEYAFQDIRLARVACPTLNLQEFIDLKIRRCSQQNCKNISYRDFNRKTYECPDCNTELK